MKLIAAPQAATEAPAAACSHRPSDGILRMPTVVRKTAASIVSSVTRPNTMATAKTSDVLCRAAGYMNSGMSASQGPSTKMMNIAQGVMDLPVFLCTCEWSLR